MKQDIEQLDNLASWLDTQFKIPFIGVRFGLDSLLGIIPGIGDSLTAILSLFLLHKARKYNIPRKIQFKMMWNVFIDWLIGLIPFVGDVFDIGWKANIKNINYIKGFLHQSETSFDHSETKQTQSP